MGRNWSDNFNSVKVNIHLCLLSIEGTLGQDRLQQLKPVSISVRPEAENKWPAEQPRRNKLGRMASQEENLSEMPTVSLNSVYRTQ